MKFKNLIFSFCIALLVGCQPPPEPPKPPLQQKYATPAEEGNRHAQYMMAESLCCRQDTPQDLAKAVDWLCKSAKQGYAPAYYLFGRLYENDLEGSSQRTPTNAPMALAFYDLASRQRYDDAYERGLRIRATLDRTGILQSRYLTTHWPEEVCQ